MFKMVVFVFAISLSTAFVELHAADGVMVIGHPGSRQLDLEIVEKIYTGKLIQVGNVFVVAVNTDVGSSVRERFLQAFLKQDEGKYTGYWRVRQSIGQGKPPREFSRSVDVINFVNAAPAAIGYITEADLQPGLNVLPKYNFLQFRSNLTPIKSEHPSMGQCSRLLQSDVLWKSTFALWGWPRSR
jgi:hypothetical protein